MAARKRRLGHGGRRAGAGRPRIFEEPVRRTVTYEAADFEALEEVAEREGVPVSAVIREAVRVFLKRRGKK